MPISKLTIKPVDYMYGAILVRNIGIGIQNLVIARLLYDATHSAVDFGLVLVLENLIVTSLQLFAGPLVDGGHQKRIMATADVLTGAIICVASMSLTQQTVFQWIVAAVVVMSITKPFFSSAAFAIGPAIAPGETLIRYNSFSVVMIQVGQIIGVVCAGIFLGHFGSTPTFFLNGLAYIISAGLIGMTRIPVIEAAPDSREKQRLKFFQGWGEFVEHLQIDRGLMWQLILVNVNFLLVLFVNVALVPIVAVDFHGNPYWLSILDGSFAVGAFFSSSLIASFISRWATRRTVLGGLLVQVMAFVGLALGDGRLQMGIFLLSMLSMGMGNTISLSAFMTSLQTRTPPVMRGRTAAASKTVLAILSMILIPLVTQVQTLSLQYGILLSAGIGLLFIVIILVLEHPKLVGNHLFNEPMSR
ncbi:MFS transporter [Sulfobacillus thermosulfidooxidans]|uniref:MFS transporter n=1 Tax=Sulfobacillus thermosulfidooxidans TaxID=28034 RepID=UPI00096B8A8F|nr:MFS transporter [Sulfobacillus thermosulfidooxidans]OLZ08836.1 hypothetical protein BFX05_14700 [Sulfobacillus thermosulfidooxidans]OLZ14796.1 hypothetical protein BFX06_05705 [Sulfobacillus thermosulfidooxidans]OLZ22060.1 hypothetical protein BFX07_10665 [Sulfobacillus thermosulfidooxidans]